MLDSVKKVLYAGIGAVALSEEKSRQIVAELVKQGEISSQEGEKLLGDMKDRFVSTGKSVEEKVAGVIKSYLSIEDLEKRVSALEKEVAELKAKN